MLTSLIEDKLWIQARPGEGGALLGYFCLRGHFISGPMTKPGYRVSLSLYWINILILDQTWTTFFRQQTSAAVADEKLGPIRKRNFLQISYVH